MGDELYSISNVDIVAKGNYPRLAIPRYSSIDMYPPRILTPIFCAYFMGLKKPTVYLYSILFIDISFSSLASKRSIPFSLRTLNLPYSPPQLPALRRKPDRSDRIFL